MVSGAFDYESGTGVFKSNGPMPGMIWTPDSVYTSLETHAQGLKLPGKHWSRTTSS